MRPVKARPSRTCGRPRAESRRHRADLRPDTVALHETIRVTVRMLLFRPYRRAFDLLGAPGGSAMRKPISVLRGDEADALLDESE